MHWQALLRDIKVEVVEIGAVLGCERSIIGGKLIHRPSDDADDEDGTAQVAQTSCAAKYGRCSHIYENPVQHYRPQLPHFRPRAVKTSALMKVVLNINRS